MLRFLHQLSAFFFYLLGSTFFVAFVLLRNDMAPPWPAYWMQVADLPLALVTILYGYNDKSGAHTKAYFKDSLNDYLDRIARKTGGKTAVLLLPTIPGMGPRFVMMDDFADAVRETAQARGLACFDLQKVFKAIGREKINDLLADMAHPNAEGHRLIAEAIANVLAGAGGR